MRLSRLDLTRYGKFTNHSIDFGHAAAVRPDLHIIYGPNEAGKSTIFAAYLDLLIRSCPPGLQGTVLMMSTGLYYIATRFGDVLGASLYENYGGFSVCVGMMTLVYAAILPVLRLIPQGVAETADGDAGLIGLAPDRPALSKTALSLPGGKS